MSSSRSLITSLTLGLVLFAGTVQAASWEKINELGVLTVAVYRDYVPYSFKDGSVTRGIDVDIARAIADRLELSLALMPFTADESLEDDLRNMVWKGHYLGTGTADLMMHVPVDDELAEDNDQVTILGPYYHAKLAVLFDPAQVAAINALTDLDDILVGVETDQLADHYLTAVYGGRYRDNVVHYMLPEEAATALRAREIQAFMGPLTHIQGALGPDVANYKVSYPPLRGLSFDGWDVGVAVKEDNAELARRVAEAIQALRADGTVEKIFASYHVSYRPPEAD